MICRTLKIKRKGRRKKMKAKKSRKEKVWIHKKIRIWVIIWISSIWTRKKRERARRLKMPGEKLKAIQKNSSQKIKTVCCKIEMTRQQQMPIMLFQATFKALGRTRRRIRLMTRMNRLIKPNEMMAAKAGTLLNKRKQQPKMARRGD